MKPPVATPTAWEHRRCPECRHESTRIGPFLICRNLRCPKLVVGVFQ